jgi:hypothetical protein
MTYKIDRNWETGPEVTGCLRTATTLGVRLSAHRDRAHRVRWVGAGRRLRPGVGGHLLWVGQGLLAVAMIFGEGELAGRVRTGQVSADLLRPVDLQAALLAEDVGRAGYAMLTRFAVPVVIGGLALHWRCRRRPFAGCSSPSACCLPCWSASGCAS